MTDQGVRQLADVVNLVSGFILMGRRRQSWTFPSARTMDGEFVPDHIRRSLRRGTSERDRELIRGVKPDSFELMGGPSWVGLYFGHNGYSGLRDGPPRARRSSACVA
ncbi:hypothetical protein NL676_023793 [Syzygium grande]|nr:hypothetical protein NL676_023793 [Syzygium grande]